MYKYSNIHSNQIQVKEIESFVIVYKYKDRFTSPFARTLRVITKMFGELFQHEAMISFPIEIDSKFRKLLDECGHPGQLLEFQPTSCGRQNEQEGGYQEHIFNMLYYIG